MIFNKTNNKIYNNKILNNKLIIEERNILEQIINKIL